MNAFTRYSQSIFHYSEGYCKAEQSSSTYMYAFTGYIQSIFHYIDVMFTARHKNVIVWICKPILGMIRIFSAEKTALATYILEMPHKKTFELGL